MFLQGTEAVVRKSSRARVSSLASPDIKEDSPEVCHTRTLRTRKSGSAAAEQQEARKERTPAVDAHRRTRGALKLVTQLGARDSLEIEDLIPSPRQTPRKRRGSLKEAGAGAEGKATQLADERLGSPRDGRAVPQDASMGENEKGCSPLPAEQGSAMLENGGEALVEAEGLPRAKDGPSLPTDREAGPGVASNSLEQPGDTQPGIAVTQERQAGSEEDVGHRRAAFGSALDLQQEGGAAEGSQQEPEGVNNASTQGHGSSHEPGVGQQGGVPEIVGHALGIQETAEDAAHAGTGMLIDQFNNAQVERTRPGFGPQRAGEQHHGSRSNLPSSPTRGFKKTKLAAPSEPMPTQEPLSSMLGGIPHHFNVVSNAPVVHAHTAGKKAPADSSSVPWL